MFTVLTEQPTFKEAFVALEAEGIHLPKMPQDH